MPGGDRTGPMGMGPMTGRGAGYCGGAGAPGFMNALGRGFFGAGRGRGGRGGRGWRNMFFATGLTGWQRAAMGVSPAAAPEMSASKASEREELDILKAQAEAAAATLEQLRQRIDEMATNPEGAS